MFGSVYQAAEKGPCKKRNRHMWGCGLRPHPHICRFISFRVGIFSMLLEADAAGQDPGAEGGEALEVSEGGGG